MEDYREICTNKQGSSEEAQYVSSVEKAKKLEEQYSRNFVEYPHGFHLIDGKIYFEKPPKSKDGESSLNYVCSELRVSAYVRDFKNENHGRLVRFPDPEGNMHELVIPADLLAGDATALRVLLLNQGMRIANNRNARQLLADLILESLPKQKIFCTDQVGWYRNIFVLPCEVIGKGDEGDIRLLNSTMNPNRFSVAGTLGSWRESVARYCSKNSRLLFSVSAAFAPPLLHLAKVESGGVHIRGPSSIGKTTLLKVANAVWDSPENLPTWRTTSNGLEAIAVERNDCLLCLDELSQVGPEEVGRIAYMLANGMGKIRGKCYGGSQKTGQWRIFYISTGEVSLALHIRKSGQRALAGQEVRISEISADTGVYGIFECLHGFNDGAEFSNYLNQACYDNHGTAIREFIKRICFDETAAHRVQSMIEEYQKVLISEIQGGQVFRTARRFALIAAAGELATEYRITGWNQGESLAAVQTCFNEWLLSYGESNKESEHILESVKEFFLKHAESRFTLWDDALDQIHGKIHNRAGFKKVQADGGWEFYVFKQVFRKEICSDFDYRDAEQICIQNGLIMIDSQGRTARSEQLPGNKKNTRVYRFTSRVLEE